MLRAPRRGSGRGRRAMLTGFAGTALALIAAACGPASAGSSPGEVGTTPVDGGVATYATEPDLNVNYIFPFVNPNYIDVSNTNDFQYLMYRPLYWFGQGTQPYLNEPLSLAYPPKYSGRQVTIKLKPFNWSNGKPVTAQNVIFWINMQLGMANSANEYGGTVSGDFPFNISNVHAVGTGEIAMTMTKPYSAQWFTDNELSQVTPMPEEWDRTSATATSNCSSQPSACPAVYKYLDSQSAGKATSWASSPLWSIVDGPWKLLSANNDGYAKLGINPHYSGPLPAHHISNFVIEPFTSEQAEFNVLQDPQGGQRLDVGYLPTVDAPVPPPGEANGGNPATLGNYKLTVLYPWELTYFPYNYVDPKAGPIFKQLYFRQAFQSMIDQEGTIDGPLHGYGKPTIGPVTSYPVTNYLAPKVAQGGDQWELNLIKAKQLLSSHGWSVVPNGVDKCISPGSGPANCGPGIARNAQLNFSMIYASGIDYMYSATKELVSNASLAGIQITATGEPIGDILTAAFCVPAAGQPPCPGWQLADWGSWTYSPDFLPTGEELFESNSNADAGFFNNATDNALITKTVEARSNKEFFAAMYKWQEFLAPYLPVVYQPNVPTLVETVNNLNIGPQSSTLAITPENWYFLK
jgi:peptide/nickel transport system substrate-binding protein